MKEELTRSEKGPRLQQARSTADSRKRTTPLPKFPELASAVPVPSQTFAPLPTFKFPTTRNAAPNPELAHHECKPTSLYTRPFGDPS